MKKVKETFSIDDGDGGENVTFSNERAFFLKLCCVFIYFR